MRAIVRQLQDPAVRFVAVSIALYSGVLWVIVSTVDRTLLNTPAAIAIVTTIVIHTAGAGPIIRERTGSFSRAALLAVGAPLTLFAMGAAAAIVIERSDLAPAAQSALLTPWWFLYPTLAFWATREKWRAAGEGDREERQGSRSWVLVWAGAMVLIPLVVASAIAVFALQLSYFRAGG